MRFLGVGKGLGVHEKPILARLGKFADLREGGGTWQERWGWCRYYPSVHYTFICLMFLCTDIALFIGTNKWHQLDFFGEEGGGLRQITDDNLCHYSYGFRTSFLIL